ncbi:hypothetical protein AB0333_08975 [Citricoccus sp. NPDC079358]|uniref:hypothetical protein n=1 Tax=Citricoccus sp. NPDC079358 TaxID=3154653 RepID=UPI0034506D22
MTSSDDSSDGTTNDQPWVPPPWDPPLAGTEIEHVLGSLGAWVGSDLMTRGV